MWKYCTVEQCNDFLLSFNLINKNWSDEKKLKCLYSLSNNVENHYKKIEIRKQNGEIRKILAPDYLLKHVQTNLLHNILNGISISKYATAYYKGADIINNVAPHLNQKKVLKLDIKDFFGTIHFKTIYKNVFKTIYYPPSIKMILVNLCCYDEYLPQGAPTSAAISNIIMRPFDEYIGKWCEERNIVYTRYCDDMTFSGDIDANIVKNKVKSFLEVMNFQLNHKKTKILTNNKRQIVTGIVINEKVQTSKTYRKKLRQEVYYIKKFGIISHMKRSNINLDSITYLKSLLGKVNFILHINSEDDEFIRVKEIIKKEIITLVIK